MMHNVMRLAILHLVFLTGLPGVTADGYDLGGEDAICWLSQQTLASDNPNGTLPDRVSKYLSRCPRCPRIATTRCAPRTLMVLRGAAKGSISVCGLSVAGLWGGWGA
jgi:hypothetical protein